MARTKKRLKIIIMGHRDSLSYLIVSWQMSSLQVLHLSISLVTLGEINIMLFNSQRQDCSTASGDFLFKQRSIRHKRFYVYGHGVSGLYLTCLCDGRDGLFLIGVNSSTARRDRRLRFRNLMLN